LRGDLDNIVLMALRKEPERRYPSAREFADDIRRYRDGEPVLARAESYVYRLGKRVQRNAFALVSTGVSISVALAWLLTVQFGEQGATPASNTLAVIPFTGLDGASRNDLGDAMAEESIRSLAAQPRLYVLASQVSFPVAENGLSLRALSRRLEVRSILHGRAGLRGGHLEVTAELVDAVSGKLLWTETYRREPMKLSAVQDLVTTQVIAALQREFDLALERPQQVPVPANFETYENYLLGQHYLWQRTPESIGKAIGVLNQAVELDPDYAAAWSLLAAVYNAGVAHLGNRASMLDHAEAAALRALELDPSLGLPHTVLGSVYYNRGDLGTGFRHMQTAMSLDPEDPTTLTWYAEALATLGHLQEALASARAAYARAPVSPVSDARLGWAHLLNGNYQRGAEFCGRAWGAGLRGTNAVWLCLVVASLESGDRSGLEGWWNAVEWGELAGRAERAYLAARHSPDPNTREAAVRQVIAAVEAGQLQVEYMESAYAVYLAGTLGALDWVYRYLHDRLDRHEVVNETIWWLPAMRALRADPRFSDLARRKGLFGAWEVLGWPDQCDLEGETLACR
jgi:TolB-like protein/Flp pilus assembly protein TadD